MGRTHLTIPETKNISSMAPLTAAEFAHAENPNFTCRFFEIRHQFLISPPCPLSPAPAALPPP